MFEGPYYAHYDVKADESQLNDEIAATVRHVAHFVSQNGPFHAIIGFSQVCMLETHPLNLVARLLAIA